MGSTLSGRQLRAMWARRQGDWLKGLEKTYGRRTVRKGVIVQYDDSTKTWAGYRNVALRKHGRKITKDRPRFKELNLDIRRANMKIANKREVLITLKGRNETR